MKIPVLGGLGNMGRRYQAILRYLGHEPLCLDLGSNIKDAFSGNYFSHVIIATPTSEHAQSIVELNRHGQAPMSILCEKPVCIHPGLTQDLFSDTRKWGNELYCVNQYAYLPEAKGFRKAIGDSYYNYYQHGKDGIHWDCFQIHALSRLRPELDDDSPKWVCRINGVSIDLRNMDRAYIHMIADFLGPQKGLWGQEIVVKTTERIARIL